jgi:hypothetical protein
MNVRLRQKRTSCDPRVMSALPPIADICSAPAHVRFGPIADISVSKVATKAKLFSRELMLLDGALKSFRHTFDPVVETIISLNWQYSNDFALPGRGTPKRRLKIDDLADCVFMRHLRVSCPRSGTMSRRFALT